MSLIVIDNYDSFTYNLVQYFGELGAAPRVFRNDQVTLGEIEAMSLILRHVRDDEPEVRGHQSLSGGLVALLRQSCQTALFGGVGDQGQLLDIVEVLVESSRWGGTKEPLGAGFRASYGGC